MDLKPIGVVKSPFKTQSDAPRQGRFSDAVSEIVIFDEYADGLYKIENFRYLIVLYWMDRASREKLRVIPPGESEERGVFTTRSPSRPNPIGFCVVEVLEVERNRLKVRWLDALDNSPVIDIKMYSPEIDCVNRYAGQQL
ncbi:MAG: tRNA (N6-threonylcarbamoyladenosine(37)-N6)-methyltransferase TrmO [Archaeoglobus sp.]|uniref:tRNA (N6-threonylcarbamoyladenosine(37)-N6)-methyltransferase TrmO n=1 Tax=Archaeoglobus sp. TaxID=1872626 RepID=UPI001E0235B8|nr:tRNA (N6-threonylcarbamoyladenosine(37)-N6)-methyltransferase TrmO [Archaeoglobus sp.]MBO8179789.1 tRNA (N6-threonylcarbamoyladenosine(37)-N6)-methyltransferase TrmO [Archaeoglobus sp.]